jgi:protein TonB
VTPLRLSLCISLGLHLALAGAALWFGIGRAPVQLPPGERETFTTLTLVAAPNDMVADAKPEAPAATVEAPIETKPEVPETPDEPIPKPETGPKNEPVVADLPKDIGETNASPSVEPEPRPIAKPPPASLSRSNLASVPTPNTGGVTATNHAPRTGDGSASKPGDDPTSRQALVGVPAQPDYQKNPEPPYPAAARRRRQEGLVLLRVGVDAAGYPVRVELKQSSGFAQLDEAALTAVRSWEFKPARIGSKTVDAEIEVPVRFKLTD